jgi:hypothetical protein
VGKSCGSAKGGWHFHLTIEQQATATAFIPSHRFKDNFLDFYAEFVNNNKRPNPGS